MTVKHWFVLVLLLTANLQATSYMGIGSQRHARANPLDLQLFGELVNSSDSTMSLRTIAEETSADKLWAQGLEGQGVKVAVIDSGIDFSHQTFEFTPHSEYSFVSVENGYAEDEDATDFIGHGTAVASLITGNGSPDFLYRGMAQNVTLISLKVASQTAQITITGVLKAISKAIELDVDIINLSLGALEAGPEIDVLEQAVEEAVSQGIIVVTSAGNDGYQGSSSMDPFTIGTPGSAPDVITVGNIRFDYDLSYSSSEGPAQLLIQKPDVVVFGTGIRVADTNNGYTSKTGTSFSAPIITGLLSLIISGYNPGEVKSALLRGARSLGLSSNQGNLFPNISRSYQLLSDPQPFITSVGNQKSRNIRVSVTSQIANEEWKANVPTSKITGLYTQVLDLDTSKLVGDEVILESSSGKLSFNVGKVDYRRKALVDMRYTNLDSYGGVDRLLGKDMRAVVDYLSSRKFEIIENFDRITARNLSEFDLVFFPDFGTVINDTDDGLGSKLPQILDDEVINLYQYYLSGGSILIDFNGRSVYDTYYGSKTQNIEVIQTLLSRFGLTIFGESSGYVNGVVVQSTEMGYGVSPVYASAQSIDGGIPLIKNGMASTSVALVSKGRVVVDTIRKWRSDIPNSDSPNFVYGKQRMDWLLDRNITLEVIPTYNGTIEVIFSSPDFTVSEGIKSGNVVTVDTSTTALGFDISMGDKFVRGSIVIPRVEEGLSVEINSVKFSGRTIPLDDLYIYDNGELVDSFPTEYGDHQVRIYYRYSEDTFYFGDLYYTLYDDGTVDFPTTNSSLKFKIVFVLLGILALPILKKRSSP